MAVIRFEIVYAHSTIEVPIAFFEERGLRVTDDLYLTADEVWLLSECTDCGLALSDHPIERRARGPKRRYCRAARRSARSMAH